MPKTLLLAAVCLLVVAATPAAQRGVGRGRGAGPAVTAREAAPIDLTGYWVSPIIEDWKYRMVTPERGVFNGVPLNAEGRTVGERWDPARDEAAGEQCRAYGAGGIMRLPGRLRVSWQDDITLKAETDAGTQTRLLRFADPPGEGAARGGGAPASDQAGGRGGAPSEQAATWQGQSVAEWNVAGRTLTVVTTHLRPGYVRRNGVPYSDRAVVTEYWTVNELPNGDRWLTVITRVEDPQYFTRPYTTSSDFKKLGDGAGWNPTPCAAR